MATVSKLQGRRYEPGSWETVPCPACGSDAFTPYERVGDRSQYLYQACRKCSLVVLNPRPRYDEAFVEEAYAVYGEDDAHIRSGDPEHPALQRQVELLRREMEDIARLAPRPGRLLDVGCKAGEFLLAARQLVGTTEGVEISPALAAVARKWTGCVIHETDYLALTPPEPYDVVRMSHVIEHIPKPREWLVHTRKLLSPSGLLVLSVPNVASIDRRAKLLLKRLGLRRGRWHPWQTPDHLFEPSLRSFGRLLADTGFRVIEVSTYSRRTMVPRGLIGGWLHKRMKWGANLRFYACPG